METKKRKKESKKRDGKKIVSDAIGRGVGLLVLRWRDVKTSWRRWSTEGGPANIHHPCRTARHSIRWERPPPGPRIELPTAAEAPAKPNSVPLLTTWKRGRSLNPIHLRRRCRSQSFSHHSSSRAKFRLTQIDCAADRNVRYRTIQRRETRH